VLQDAPDHVEALMNAGLNEHVLGRFTEARRHYDRALSIDPANATAWCYLGLLLNELMDSTGAVNALQKALQLNPMDVEARVELAAVHEQNNRLEQAREMVDAGLAMDPYHPALRLELGRLERREGRIEAALEILRSVNPQHLQPRMATRYHFELGQVLDRHGDHDGAFAAFTASNALQAQSPRRAAIDVDGFSRRASRMQDWLSRGAPGANPAAGELHGDLGADLCFLLGFPRSGTTLLDTFLNAHPAVASIEEYPTLERVIDELRGHPDGYPECLESIDTARLLSLRELYREEVARYLPGREPALILDKLPLRTLNVALIHRLFPAARILLALRHPCDAVLSNFMQQYTENEAFIHFDTLADSAGMYDTVMRVWQTAEQVLDLNAHRTRYEDLVADPGGELDRICTFLSLERVPEMMDTQTRLGAHDRIRTPSYQQVAEPVYRRAAGRWLNYRRHFDPVMDCLEPHIRYFGYAQEDPGDDHGTSGHG
jgi:tetratricopeptide (TPR) repeat protein